MQPKLTEIKAKISAILYVIIINIYTNCIENDSQTLLFIVSLILCHLSFSQNNTAAAAGIAVVVAAIRQQRVVSVERKVRQNAHRYDVDRIARFVCDVLTTQVLTFRNIFLISFFFVRLFHFHAVRCEGKRSGFYEDAHLGRIESHTIPSCRTKLCIIGEKIIDRR